MSAISLKSITGITSITTPAGVDNQLTLHTNDTTQRVKVSQSGIEIVGVSTFQDIDVDGHANLDHVNVSGTSTITGVLYPQNGIRVPDDIYSYFGTGNDLSIRHHASGGNHSYIFHHGAGAFKLGSDTQMILGETGPRNYIQMNPNSDVKLYFNNNQKLATSNTGITVTGTAVATGADINGDLDVDGHTNLDNVSIAGVTTITGSGSSVLFLESSNPMIRLTDTDNSAYSSIGGESGFLYLYTNSSSRDVIFRGSQEVARLTGDGLLGIGTNNPTASIHLHKASGDTIQKIESSNGAAALELRHTNGYGYINYFQDGAETFRVGQIAQFTSYSVYNPSSSLPYQLCVEGNGEVGINTHNPANTLHLLRNTNHGITLQKGGTNPGSALIQVASYGALNLEASNNLTLQSGGSQQIFFNRGGTTVAKFDTSGRFGINQSTPASRLHISEVGSNTITIQLTNATTGHTSGTDGMTMGYSTNSTAGFINVCESGSHFTIKTGGTAAGNERLRIKSDGKVGIATDNPKRALHVNDTVGEGIAVVGATSGIQFGLVDMAGASYNAILSRAGTNDNHIAGSTPRDLCLAPEREGAFILGLSPHLGAMTTGVHISRLRHFNIYYGGDFKINTGSPASPSEKIRIDSSGNIGAGIAPSSGARLWIATNDNPFVGTRYNAGADGSVLFLQHSRSNTIGTNVALNDNDEVGTVQFRAYASNNSSVKVAASIKAEVNGTTGTGGVPTDLIFATGTNSSNATERLRIDTSGNVQIGTAADPGNALRYVDIGNYNTGSSAGSIFRLLTKRSDGSSSTSADIVKYKAGGLVINNNEAIGTTGFISFGTATGGGSTTERLRIESGGDIRFNSADNVIHTGADTSRLRLFGGSTNSVNNGAVLTLHGVNHSSGNYADLASGTGGHIQFRTGTNERLRIASGGDVTVTDGDLVIGTGGHGIDFYNYGSGTGIDSNLLDDYERGVATFQLHIAGSEASGVSYTYNTAPYIKVGRMVWCAISMFATNLPTTTGYIDIANLPFVDGGGGGYREPSFLAANHGGAGTYVISGAMHGGGTKIRIRKNGNQDLDGSDIGSTFWMHGHITYMANA